MKKFSFILFLVTGCWLLVTGVYAQETLELLTYYPAPYGVYETLRIHETDESITQTNFTQSLANAGIIIETEYTNNAFTPGIFWSTSNNNPTLPKAGIYLRETGAQGSYMYFGTSSVYATGITNDAMVIDPFGKVGIGINNPGATLDVNGDSTILGHSRNSYVLVGNNQYCTTPATQFNPGYYVYRSGNTLYGMKLQYNGTSYGTAIFASNQNNRLIQFGRLSGTSNDNQFTPFMTIEVGSNQEGSVGMGITDPDPNSRLHVITTSEDPGVAILGQQPISTNMGAGVYGIYGCTSGNIPSLEEDFKDGYVCTGIVGYTDQDDAYAGYFQGGKGVKVAGENTAIATHSDLNITTCQNYQTFPPYHCAIRGDVTTNVGSFQNSLAGVYGTATVQGSSSSGYAYGVYGEAEDYGVYGKSSGCGIYGEGGNGIGVKAQSNVKALEANIPGAGAGGAANSYAIYVSNLSSGTPGTITGRAGIYAEASDYGVYGKSYAKDGIHGESNSGCGGKFLSSTHVGVIGYSGTGSPTEYSGAGGIFEGPTYGMKAVCSTDPPGAGNYAGYFTGKVWVSKDLACGGAKPFIIDHPLEPETMQLVHACIEGPETAVYYRGETELIDGQVEVLLPNYFESLTRKEGRTVLLTCKNGFSPLYVEGEIENGKFLVKTTETGNLTQSFYWELKAVRADIEPLAVEREKEIGLE